jgi:eukaryotic-like serine/threonine-protein kinase
MSGDDTNSGLSDSDNDRIVKAVREYLLLKQRGEAPEHTDYVAGYPGVEAAIRDCLVALDLIAETVSALTEASVDRSDDSSVSSRIAALPWPTLGDFRLVRPIGSGGMGIVYEAEQISLRRRVALKILPTTSVLEPRKLTRFKTEAMAAASLSHPNIVRVYGVGCESGVHYYAMEFIDGCSLSDKGHTLSIGECPHQQPSDRGRRYRAVAQFGVQAATALEYAHQMGIVHRDIKPSNLLIDGQAKLWITDFGLAMIRGADAISQTGDVVGTLRYMSPEQATGPRHVLDHRTDVYSLGITLYEMLVGRPAFCSDDHAAIVRQICEFGPTSPRRLNRSIPKDLETIVLKAIDRLPHRRYASAQEMADDLQRFVDGRPVHARRTQWPQRVRSFVQRNPVLSTLTAALFGLVLFVASREVSLRLAAEEKNHVLSIGAAWRAYQEFNLERCRELTRRSTTTYASNFETRLLNALLEAAESTPTIDHGAPVQAVSLTSDERTLLTGGRDGFVRLWDLSSSRHTVSRKIYVHPDGVESLDISPDGTRLATSGALGSVALWDIATGELIKEFPTNGPATVLKFSPNGDVLAWSEYQDYAPCQVSLCSLTSFAITTTQSDVGMIADLAFSPDGTGLAAATQVRLVAIWDVSQNRGKFSLDFRETLKHPNQLFAIAFSRDGRQLAAGGYDFTTTVWNLETRRSKVLRLPGHSVTALEFTPDGRGLLSGGRNNVSVLWDLVTGDVKHVTRGHTDEISSLVLGRQGHLLITGSKDGTARIWKIPSIRPSRSDGESHPVRRIPVAFLPDQSWIVVGSGVWGKWDELRWEHGSRLIAMATGEQELLDPVNFVVNAVAVSPAANDVGGKYAMVATGGFEVGSPTGKVELRNSQSRQRVSTLPWPLRSPVRSLAFSPTGNELAIGMDNGFVVWDCSKRRVVIDAVNGRQCFSVCFTPNGEQLWVGASRILVANRYWTDSGMIDRWSMLTGQKIAPLRGHRDIVMSIASSPVGHTMATGSLDRTIRIWNADTGRCMHTLTGHAHWVFGVAFSADGQTLASACGDATLKLWHLATGEELLTFNRSFGVVSVAFSPGGESLVGGHADESLGIWHASGNCQSWPQELQLTSQSLVR